MKTCVRCRLILDSLNFTKDRNRRDGLSPYCRSCASILAAEYYQAKPRPVRHPLKSLKRFAPPERFHMLYTPEPNSGCWLWEGRPQGSNGYGRMKVGGHSVPAHRYAYEIHKGQVPVGMQVCHRCDVPLCVNPDHLFLGTGRDNKQDCVAKDRHIYGARHSRAKLTDGAVKAILADRRKHYVIAIQYGVSSSLIGKIKSRKMWRHVNA